MKSVCLFVQLVYFRSLFSFIVNMSEQETLQSFSAGEALFMRTWPYAWAELQKPGSAVAGKVGVSLPVAAPGPRAATTQGRLAPARAHSCSVTLATPLW